MKTILITGGTNGIGLSALKVLTQEDYFPILICRSKEKAENTLKELGRGKYYLCDLEDLSALKTVGYDILAQENHIDYFVANAGVIGYDKERMTAFGVEMTVQTNFMAHFLLTEMLMPLFEKSTTTLIFTSSLMHKSKLHANYDFSIGINAPKYTPFKAYARSKACLTSYASYLAEKHPTVKVFMADPGVSATGIMRSRGKLMNTLYKIAQPLFSSSEKGAQPILACIQSDFLYSNNALYIKGKRPIAYSNKAQNKVFQAHLYEKAQAILAIA